MITCYEFFGKINHSFKTTIGEECAKILNTLGKKEMGALESYIKNGGADAVGKRVLESVMEKASKATPLTPSKTLNPNTSKKLLPSQKSTLENGVEGKYKTYEKKQTGFVSKFNESHKIPLRSITQKEREFIKNFDNIQNGKNKIGVVAEWVGDTKGTIHQLYARKDYIDEIIKKHWDFNKENLIITAKDAEYILQSKNGKSINYIKQVTPNEFLLLSAKKSVSGKDVITHFPIEPKNIQYIQKLQKEMNTIKSPWLPTTTEGLGRHTANQGDFPQYISNPSKVNSKPLLPSQPLNLSPKNTPLLTSAQKEAQARVSGVNLQAF